MRLLKQVRMLTPKLVILDSEFVLRPSPVIQLVKERTDNILNATPQYEGQEQAVKGVPSLQAMELMAAGSGYDLDWVPLDHIPKSGRRGIKDYFKTDTACRATCVLRPRV